MPFEWSFVWPILLISLGVVIAVSSILGRRRHSAVVTHGPASVNVRLMFAGREDHYDGRPFEGGAIQCSCAGYKLDLRGAQMVGDEAVLEVSVVIGGIELIIPRSWRVDVDGSPVMGGFEDKTIRSDEPTSKLLVVRGKVVMGGVEVEN